MRPAVRLAALMDIDTIYIRTHDPSARTVPRTSRSSTWPPLRAIPQPRSVVRPGDANETASAPGGRSWSRGASSVRSAHPDPGKIPVPTAPAPTVLPKGRVMLGGGNPTDDAAVILIATGSEPQLAVEAQLKLLADRDINATVVSMPCVEWFEAQPQDYQDAVLPPVCRHAWPSRRASRCRGMFVGDTGEIVSIEHFRRIRRRQDLCSVSSASPRRRGGRAKRALDN